MSYYSDMTIEDMSEEIKELEEKLRVAIEALEFIAKTNSPKTSYEAKQALELITKEV